LDSKTVIKILNENGWYQVAQKGSHIQFKHAQIPGRVTVKHPTKDLQIDLIKSIEKQSGIKLIKR
jgi:predicted RNA binding protein YcfA (HicA-like mRNA interferase family)